MKDAKRHSRTLHYEPIPGWRGPEPLTLFDRFVISVCVSFSVTLLATSFVYALLGVVGV